MTISQFINKWSPIEEPHLVDVFTRDLLSVFDMQGSCLPYKRTAIDVLSNIPGAELIIDVDPSHLEYPQGRISFGKQGESLVTGTIVYYSLAVGQEEADWRYLLECLAKQSLKQ